VSAARAFGLPRLHYRATDSTNSRARELAARGVPDGTLITADAQSAGRGRQGRTWSAPAGRALLCSLVIREPPRLLPLAAGVAVAELVAALAAAEAPRERSVAVKWPNDVLLDGRKVAGILVEGRPQERWAVLGIGLNVALAPEDFPPELRETAATLGLGAEQREPVLEELLRGLARWVAAGEQEILAAFRARDALRGRPVRWSGGVGTGAGIDAGGRLLVDTAETGRQALDAGEVHLGLANQSS
jgi:BirA family biotin operon repressor/biotin-[acetyl-CoA-carboxylase] ligase